MNLCNEMEECAGCYELDSKLNVGSDLLFSCCAVTDNYNYQYDSPPGIYWADNDWDMERTISAYFKMREKLSDSIKKGEACRCTGCGQITHCSRPFQKKIKEIAFALSDPCQLSCIYCRQKNAVNPDYINAKADIKRDRFTQTFDYKHFLEILEQRRLLSDDVLIVMASGEITINPRIDEILDAVQNYRLVFFTNAVTYNDRIAALTARPGSSQLISVDAGTRETYKSIKGMDAFGKVWANIKEYIDNGSNTIIKYVVIKDNCNKSNMEGFINELLIAGVKEFRISANYFREAPYTHEEMKLMAKLISMAECNGIKVQFEATFKHEEQTAIMLNLQKETYNIVPDLK